MKRGSYSSKKSKSAFIVPVIIVCVILYIAKAVSDGKMYFEIRKGPNDAAPEISKGTAQDIHEDIIAEETKETKETKEPEKPDEENTEHRYSFSSGLAEEIYNTICSSFNEFDLSIHIEKEADKQVLKNAVEEAVEVIWTEDPEYFWTGGYSTVTDGTYIDINFKTIYDLNGRELSELNSELQNAADELINRIPENSSDYEKALFIHDSIINSAVYDLDGRDSDLNGPWDTAYGCLVEHKAVCRGYSCAYKLIMDKLGIECGIVSGFGKTGNHAWNYIKLEGNYYWADLTWDDPLSDDGTQTLTHKYCFLDDRFLNDHTPADDNLFIPKCRSMDLNYYKYSGRYAESYRFDEINRMISSCEGDEYAEIMFSSSAAAEECIQDLFENKRIWETDYYKKRTDRQMAHSYDPDTHIIKFKL